jgi:glycosyltransferase involved in cell wall biosynthesis
MKISIVLLNYNGAKYLEKSVQSLVRLKEKYPHLIETIVCDGLSTDGSIEILKRYSFDKVFIRKDKGQSDAINHGFINATGDWYIWLNSDDLLCDTFFENNMDKFSDSTVKWISGSVIMIDEDGVELYRSLSPRKNSFCYTPYEIYCPSTFIHKSVFRDVGLFSLEYNYCMDTHYWARLYALGFRPLIVRDWLFKFRQHSNSKTSHAFNGMPNIEFLREQKDIHREYKPVLYGLRKIVSYIFYLFSVRSLYFRLVR